MDEFTEEGVRRPTPHGSPHPHHHKNMFNFNTVFTVEEDTKSDDSASTITVTCGAKAQKACSFWDLIDQFLHWLCKSEK
jgi:hypothetical protein